MSFDDIPAGLRDIQHWVLRKDKKPCNLSGQSGGWQAPDFWLTFQAARDALEGSPGKFSGLGFIIARGPGNWRLVGVDFDCCRDPRNGWTSPFILDLLQRLDSYTEVSLSGTGYHVWVWAWLPDGMDSAESEGQDPAELPPDTWAFIHALKKTAKRCNTIELYEDGPRHFAMTGNRVPDYSANIESRQEVINYLLGLCRPPQKKTAGPGKEDLPNWAREMAEAAAGKRLPPLNILDIVDTRGWEQSGEQLRGPHPILGSSTGHNLVINPGLNLWAYMHNGINSGGDAWLWLACECGAVPWEEAGAGALKSRAVVEKTVAYAVSRQLVNAEEVVRQPGIRILKPDDQAGWIGLTPDGTIKTISPPNKDGETSPVWFSDCALGVHTETYEDGKTEFVLKGKGAKDGRPVCFTATAVETSDNRKFKQLVTNHFGTPNRIGKLDWDAVQRLTRNTLVKERVTSPRWRKNIPLVPGVGLAGDVEFKLSALVPAEVCPGDMELARECFTRILEHRRYSPILITIIMGAPVLAKWFPRDRFAAALWGETGSNKTTISQLYMAIYGIGYLDERAMIKHGRTGATENGALEALLEAGILPKLVDNVKGTDAKDSIAYIRLIQSAMEGGEKLRVKREGGLREVHNFLTTPIITGEIKPGEASTSARVFNLTWAKVLDNGTMSFLQANSGALPVIGYHWLRYLSSIDRDLAAGFSQALTAKSTEFAKDRYVNPGRLATIYTLLRALWNLMKDGPFGDIVQDHDDIFLEALEEAIAEQGAEVSEETELARFLAAVMTLRASRPDLFMTEEIRGIATIQVGRESKTGLFLFPEEVLAICKGMGIFTQAPTINSMTKALKQAGVLRNVGRHRLNETSINGKKARGWWLKPGWEEFAGECGNPTNNPTPNPPENGQKPPSGDTIPIIPSFLKQEYKGEMEKEQKDVINHEEREVKKEKLNDTVIDRDSEIDRDIDIHILTTDTVLLNPNINLTPIPPCDSTTGAINGLNLTPEQKSKLWLEVGGLLKKLPRKAEGKLGIDLDDLAGAMSMKPPAVEEILKATGWEADTIAASGIKVFWAPEKVLKAYGLQI